MERLTDEVGRTTPSYTGAARWTAAIVKELNDVCLVLTTLELEWLLFWARRTLVEVLVDGENQFIDQRN